MEILHKEVDGEFYVEKAGEQVAEMTYRLQGDDRLLIDHTWVDESLEGQGVAKHLLEKAIDYAKSTGRKIVPVCQYVKRQFEKYPDQYADIALTQG